MQPCECSGLRTIQERASRFFLLGTTPLLVYPCDLMGDLLGLKLALLYLIKWWRWWRPRVKLRLIVYMCNNSQVQYWSWKVFITSVLEQEILISSLPSNMWSAATISLKAFNGFSLCNGFLIVKYGATYICQSPVCLIRGHIDCRLAGCEESVFLPMKYVIS